MLPAHVNPATPYGLFLSEQQRQRNPEAADLRVESRRAVDRVWAGLAADCKEKYGRAPSVDASNQPSDLATAALNAAVARERDYLHLAMAAGASTATVDAAFDAFARAIVSWLREATRDWPRRRVYEAEQLAAREWWEK